MPTLRRILDSPVQMLIWSMLLGISHQASAQTASPAPAANSPAAVAAQQGLSESVLRQAQGPYRMILNSPTIVVRPPKAAATPVRTAEPVAVQSIAMAPLSAEAQKAALTAAEAATQAAAAPAVTARSAAAPSATAVFAPLNAGPMATTPQPAAAAALLPVVPAAMAPSNVVAAAPAMAVPPPKPVAAAIEAVERALIAVRQEEPVLAGPLARERPAGVVQIGFNVNANGTTSEVSVVSDTNRKLNSAVIAAVGKWVYQPLEAVRRVEVAIEFKND